MKKKLKSLLLAASWAVLIGLLVTAIFLVALFHFGWNGDGLVVDDMGWGGIAAVVISAFVFLILWLIFVIAIYFVLIRNSFVK